MIHLAATPSPLGKSVEPSVPDLFRNGQSLKSMHRPIPAPDPNPEPNPGPDAVAPKGIGTINPRDWDELFLSIQVRLEDCVCDAMLKISDIELQDRRIVTRTVVLECIQAMKQLQASLTAERGAH
jgi:hypothetical protein